ncbi:MAG: YceI family protein [Pseudomonadota bacterium]|nr:YceI family protein [Pseudomonadota bacterium]
MRISLLFPLLALAACAGDVSKDKVKAEVAAPPPIAAVVAPPPAVGGTELAVDKARSKIAALGAKITDKHDITFPDFEGKVRVDGETVSALSFTVQVGSLQTTPEKLANHLKSADFFGVDVHPSATFTSNQVRAVAGPDGATHEISGDLTLHGVTKRLTFPAKLAVSPTEVTGRAEFAINRQDFGIVYPGKPDDLIQDDVVLTIELTAPRGA